jgi:hypothetical protein
VRRSELRTSFATVTVALGLTLALVGTAVGQAIFWPGVGLILAGASGLVRERRVAREIAEVSAAGGRGGRRGARAPSEDGR